MAKQNDTGDYQDMLLNFKAEQTGTPSDEIETGIDTTSVDSEDNEPETEPIETPTAESEDTVETQEDDDQLEEVEEDDVEDEDEDDTFELDYDDEDEPDTKQTPDVDFSAISKAIGVDVKSEQDLISKFSELRAELKEAQKAVENPTIEGIDKRLQDAIEIAKQGGDYNEYLGLVQYDYSKVDPVQLFEYEVAQLFTDEKGNFDEEGYNEAIGEYSEAQMALEGRKLAKQRQAEQAANAEAYKANVARQKQEADQRLKEAVQKMTEVSGFKVTPSVQNSIYSAISSGDAFKEMFYNGKGEYDFGKISDVYFKVKYFDKMLNFHKQRAKTDTKKEIVKDLTNSSVKSTPKAPQVEPDKPVTAQDVYMEQFGIKL